MKNKKMIYILFPVTIIVWGLIIFRIFNYANQEPEFQFSEKNITNIIKDSLVIEEFEIKANYRDPFIRSIATVKKDDDKKNANKRNNRGTRTRINRKIRWPKVEYNGIVENIKNKATLAILNIDEKNCLLKNNEECNQVLVIKIYEDSIRLKYNDEEKTFRKIVNKD